ncbi:MAG: hypothetical protein H6752_17950 [Candidatus Omnitrophica bacterium]|nr:hypothetical protein [Candidatus Omnitrophota bacterium]MCB9770087.1 hypothetical protein [Candidatus Omnitrophota bacterium]
MEKLRTQIEVPEDHRIHLDMTLPEEVPSGPAELTLTISPRARTSAKADLMSFAGSLSGSALAKRNSVAVQRELRDEWD